MDSDARPYVFTLVTQEDITHWSFVAMNIKCDSMIPIEQWVVGKMSYTIYRVCYTKQDATELVKMMESKNVINGTAIGPDLYCVVNDITGQVVSSVWKPPRLNEIFEVLYGNAKPIYMKTSASFDEIKETILELMDIVPDKEIIINESIKDFKISA